MGFFTLCQVCWLEWLQVCDSMSALSLLPFPRSYKIQMFCQSSQHLTMVPTDCRVVSGTFLSVNPPAACDSHSRAKAQHTNWQKHLSKYWWTALYSCILCLSITDRTLLCRLWPSGWVRLCTNQRKTHPPDQQMHKCIFRLCIHVYCRYFHIWGHTCQHSLFTDNFTCELTCPKMLSGKYKLALTTC